MIMADMEKLKEECTHNCMTCKAGCSEYDRKAPTVTLEKALTALSDIESDDLLKALQAIGADEAQKQ